LGSQQAGKSDSEFAQGERPVYVIDEVDFNLNVGVHIDPDGDEPLGERVVLDFNAPEERRSRLQFTVSTRPVEILIGAKLELANLDPMGDDLPNARLRAWLVDDQGTPVPQHPVKLFFARAGDKRLRAPITTATDAVGRVDFRVLLEENKVKVVGVRKRYDVYLRGSVEEYFVWATAEPSADWKEIVEPAAPHPPRSIRRDKDGRPLELCSELLRLRVR